MKRVAEVLIGIMVAGVLGTGAYYLIPEKKSPGQVVREGIEKMECPDSLVLTGDQDGRLCHMIVRVMKDGTHENWVQHTIPGRDFRGGSKADHCEWIKADSIRDVEELGIACDGPRDHFLYSPAFAPIYCEDCGGGGGCVVKTCPATTHPIGPCTLGGVTCAVTYFCCDWPCAGWPPC